jgi:hypothetical protein
LTPQNQAKNENDKLSALACGDVEEALTFGHPRFIIIPDPKG